MAKFCLTISAAIFQNTDISLILVLSYFLHNADVKKIVIKLHTVYHQSNFNEEISTLSILEDNFQS